MPCPGSAFKSARAAAPGTPIAARGHPAYRAALVPALKDIKPMLVWSMIVISAVVWPSIWLYYFRVELYRWYDNRFGPEREKKRVKVERPRMYE